MALSKNSVEKAVKILKEICDYHAVAKFSNLTWSCENAPSLPNFIICWGRKEDGGYEEVCIEIENISNDVLKKFQERKMEVPNSSIERKKDKITTIGWF